MVENKNSLLRPGDSFEKYTVVQELGHGGMGAVYLVRHRVLNTNFALKVLYPGVAQRDQQFVDRFIREAQLAGRIRHQNLIAVYDAGLNESNGMYYLVMDYVSGGSVRSKLRKQFNLSVMESLDIVRQIGHALEAALQHNMVHRDIKPDNIMFDGDGVARLADLGIAKATGDHDANLTIEAAVFGTPAYMSPEQAHDSRQVDIRADIYSLGIVLFEMLTGRRPFVGGSTIEILTQVISETPAPDVRTLNPEIPESVAKLVADMIEKDLAKRIASPMELISRIEAIINDLKMASEASPQVSEGEMTMPTIMQGAASVTTPTTLSMPQAAELTMETVSQSAPQPQPQAAELTMETISQPKPFTPQPVTPSVSAPTVQSPLVAPSPPIQSPSVAPPPSGQTMAMGAVNMVQPLPSAKGGNSKIKLIVAGVIAVGLLLAAGGGGALFLLKSRKGPKKPVVEVDEPSLHQTAVKPVKSNSDVVKTTQSEISQTPKSETTSQPKVAEKPAMQTIVNPEPKNDEQPSAQPVVHPEMTKEEQPVEQPVVHPEVTKEEQPVKQPVVQSEQPKVELRPVLTNSQIQGKIVLFGGKSLLKALQSQKGEQNITFVPTTTSFSTDEDLLAEIMDKRPQLLLIAISSCYDISLDIFEDAVREMCKKLKGNERRYAFVLEPGARLSDKVARVERVCKSSIPSPNFINCKDARLNPNDLERLLIGE